ARSVGGLLGEPGHPRHGHRDRCPTPSTAVVPNGHRDARPRDTRGRSGDQQPINRDAGSLARNRSQLYTGLTDVIDGRQWMMFRAALALVPCVVAIWFASLYFREFSSPSSYYPPFTDANTYLAAGERLNSGHELYILQLGDRWVALEPSLSPAALLSPPPIAV